MHNFYREGNPLLCIRIKPSSVEAKKIEKKWFSSLADDALASLKPRQNRRHFQMQFF